MKTKRLLAGCLALSSLLAAAQSRPATSEQQQAMAAYAAAGALNENHEFLQKFAGEWEMKTTAWMAPGAPPVESRSTCRAETILGGRFLLLRFVGQMFGQPFEGWQIVGYDNLQKKYIAFWIDGTATAFFLTSGVRADSVIEDVGLWPDPLTGGQQKVRDRLALVGPDEFTYEMYMGLPGGKEFKSLENRCTRKK